MKGYSTRVVGGATHNDGGLGAWPFLHKLVENCATPTVAKTSLARDVAEKE